jgi:FSR family fosmidomycin resistance protein-like MFS transporter
VAFVGIAESYALTFAVIVFSGLGVAAFHPEGSRFANYVSGPKRASGMSLFSVGGNAGFAMGPVLVTPLVLAFGLPGTLFLIVPAALVAGWVARELPRLASFRPERRAGGEEHVSRANDRWGAFARLGGVTAARTVVYFGLITFVPLYFIGELGASKAEANGALALMLVGGAVGTLIGGPLADRIGRRATVILSLSAISPLVLAFHAAGKDLATVLVVLLGAATVATFSVTVVMGQEYLPSRIGVASGVTLGLAIGVGGLGAPLLGLVADRWGLSASIDVIAALPVIGVLMALTLPRERRRAETDDALSRAVSAPM